MDRINMLTVPAVQRVLRVLKVTLLKGIKCDNYGMDDIQFHSYTLATPST